MSGSLVALLNKTIGNSGIKLSKENEYAYYCPFCNHYKRKLQVNTETGFWHCWVCDAKGRNLFQLFRKLKASKESFDNLSGYVKYIPKYMEKSEKSENDVSLPSEFIPMWNESPEITFKHAIKFLRGRGISDNDILRYNIGYCNIGTFSNRIIIPSYDEFGKLNFFVGRDIFDGFAKYRNSPTPKDIIGFELFINWDENVTLTEGVFDAMAVKRNAIPLFGKRIGDKLKRKLVETRPPMVNICLDFDAKGDVIDIVDFLHDNDINTSVVNFDDERDASDFGFERMLEKLNDVKILSFSDIIRMKIEKSDNYSRGIEFGDL